MLNEPYLSLLAIHANCRSEIHNSKICLSDNIYVQLTLEQHRRYTYNL